jgi:hypothetical protein
VLDGADHDEEAHAEDQCGAEDEDCLACAAGAGDGGGISHRYQVPQPSLAWTKQLQEQAVRTLDFGVGCERFGCGTRGGNGARPRVRPGRAQRRVPSRQTIGPIPVVEAGKARVRAPLPGWIRLCVQVHPA